MADDQAVAVQYPCAIPSKTEIEASDPPVLTRVLVADDHVTVRLGLQQFLNMQTGMEVVGLAADGVEAIEQALQLRPDVIIMDVSMPRMNGIEATGRIKEQLPQVAVIGLSMYDDAGAGHAMRQAGACLYLSKTCPELLVAAIRSFAPQRGT